MCGTIVVGVLRALGGTYTPTTACVGAHIPLPWRVREQCVGQCVCERETVSCSIVVCVVLRAPIPESCHT